MKKIAKWLVNFSILFFMASLLYVYAYLPVSVGIQMDENQLPIQFISKELFFYVALAVFVFGNMILYFFARAAKMVEVGVISWYKTSAVKSAFLNWLAIFQILINFFLISSVIFVGLINNQQQFSIHRFNILVYLAPALLLIWLIRLPFVWFLRK